MSLLRAPTHRMRSNGPSVSLGAGKVRDAAKGDLKALVQLWREMMAVHSGLDSRFRFAPGALDECERHLWASMRSRSCKVVVAEAEGRVVGYGVAEIHVRRPIYPVGSYGFISDLAVTREFQRRGIGTQIARALLAWHRERGVDTVELFVSEANTASTAFWTSLGFGPYLRLLRLDSIEEIA